MRLTGKDKEGAFLLKCRENPCKDLKGNCNSCGHMQQALERLAEYEELDNSPEQLKEIDELFRKKCEEVARLESEKEKAIDLAERALKKMEKLVKALWQST